jgi:hypothetical protein
LYHKLNVLYQKNIAPTLLFYDIFKKLVTQCQHLEHMLYPLLAQQQAEQDIQAPLWQTANYTIPGCTTAAAAAPVVLTSSALVTACPVTSLTWCLFTACEATLACSPATGPSVITCFNCGKEGHKSLAYLEPWKPGAIHKIDKQSQDSDFTDVTDKESGKEDL